MRYSLCFIFNFMFVFIYGQNPVNFGLVGGVNFSGVSRISGYTSPNIKGSPSYSDEVFYKGTFFTGGFFIEEYHKNLTFRQGVSLLKVGQYFETKTQFPNGILRTTDEEIRVNYLQIPVDIEYVFNVGKLKPFVKTRFGISFLRSSFWKTTSDHSVAGITVKEKDIPDLENKRIFIYLGGGIYITSRISIMGLIDLNIPKKDCKWSQARSYSNCLDFGTNNLIIQINFRFFKRSYDNLKTTTEHE